MTNDILYLFFFSANLTFIITSIYGWLLKRFYVPNAYKEHVEELFPAHRIVAALYLTQLIEIPYLLMIGHPDALFYVNGIGVMVYSSSTLIMVWAYFFQRTYTKKQLFIFMLPLIITGFILTLPLLGLIPFSPMFRYIMFMAVTFVSGIYIFRLIQFRQLLHKRIFEIDEDEYSNKSDFPLHFARNVEWLPLIVCLFLYACFLINHEIAKMIRDIFYSAASVWFIFHTLNPHRTLSFPNAEELRKREISKNPMSFSSNRLTEEQSKEMENKLLNLLQEEKIFLEEHLTMGDLADRLNTNKNYLSEIIARSEHRTFYHLINTFRIEHACEMITKNPKEKLEQVAISSGFSSGSAFSQVFKRIKNMPPREFVQSLKANNIRK